MASRTTTVKWKKIQSRRDLPPAGVTVLVTRKQYRQPHTVDVATVKHGYRRMKYFRIRGGWSFHRLHDVVAWAPLPEPYYAKRKR